MDHERGTVKIETLEEPGDDGSRMAEDVREGLLSAPKDLSAWPKYFYGAEGSRLFEEITEQPEYYQTRTELSILQEKADDIVSRTRCRELVELGSGSASKTRTLLDAMLVSSRANSHQVRYVPLDVSESAVRESSEKLLAEYPGLEVRGYVGDFDHSLGRLLGKSDPGDRGDGRLVIFLGGTIGNFTPEKRRSFLTEVSDELHPGDHFLLGMDLVKDTSTLEAAYNDAAGVTADFDKNMLAVLNERLGADFDPGFFTHRAIYDAENQRIEMWLYSKREQKVHIQAADFSAHFGEGEGMRTEISTKFTPESAAATLEEAGLEMLDLYTDPRDYFGLALGKARR